MVTESLPASSPSPPNISAPSPLGEAFTDPESKKKQSIKPSTACIIGDSISANLDRKVIANAIGKEVRNARAYSSIEDTSENEAKDKTKFPDKMFHDVIKAELEKAPTDMLIIQSGSVEITNMKVTGDNPMKYGEYFKQQAVVAATNLFTAVSDALVSNPELKKAIIMKQIPRYDPTSVDPNSIKAALSQLFNDTLVQLWLGSTLKDRLSIGTHSLECHGGIRDSRYRNGKKYDGIHMFGPSGRKSYTESVLNIIKNTGNIQNSPPKYFRRFHLAADQNKPRDKYHCPTQDTDHLKDNDVRSYANVTQSNVYTVPTANRFSTLNQENY